MNDLSQPGSLESPTGNRFCRVAAMFSLLSPVVVIFIYIILFLYWRSYGSADFSTITILALLSFLLFFGGIVLGIIAIALTKRHERTGVFGKALTGICINGLLLLSLVVVPLLLLFALRNNHPTTPQGQLDKATKMLATASDEADKFYALNDAAKDKIVLPEGWRYPTAEELSDEPERKDSSTKYIKAVADFNGDGVNDEAYLVKSTKYSGEGLLVHLSDKQKGFRWLVLDTTDWGKEYPKVNLGMGIDIVKPGQYKTACGKGYFDCEKSEPKVLKLKRPAIDYFKFGSANSFFFWDDKTSSFKRIWISD